MRDTQRATPKLRVLATHIMAYETLENKSSTPKTPLAFPVVERLRPQLAALMGNGGFRALLTRALALAGTEVPWLRAVQVKADGSLKRVDELDAQIDSKEILEGKVVLLAQLLGLLVTFIGEHLTLRIVREVWPKLPRNDWDLNTGEKHEKEN